MAARAGARSSQRAPLPGAATRRRHHGHPVHAGEDHPGEGRRARRRVERLPRRRRLDRDAGRHEHPGAGGLQQLRRSAGPARAARVTTNVTRPVKRLARARTSVTSPDHPRPASSSAASAPLGQELLGQRHGPAARPRRRAAGRLRSEHRRAVALATIPVSRISAGRRRRAWRRHRRVAVGAQPAQERALRQGRRPASGVVQPRPESSSTSRSASRASTRQDPLPYRGDELLGIGSTARCGGPRPSRRRPARPG